MTIRTLFDLDRGLDRPIEKVITFAAKQEARLKAEISEYVVTDSIEEQFRKLLERMQLAMEVGGENETGVWVSGFYGSGKSSLTKYLGFAFDDRVQLDQVPFLKYLQDRFHTPQVKALLGTVAQRFPAAVVMLDLASEMLAGATMADVSTVLYYKVLEWAGYSRNLKVATLERRIEQDGRTEEFEATVKAQIPGMTWADIRNDPLAVDALIPQLAHEMYPQLFPTPNVFSSSTEWFLKSEKERVSEMIDLIRRKSGKQHILFIIDEVAQYIASRDNLILNLDGLAKNVKGQGDGKVWILATAQQTLTEDDPRASLNSDKLYKLKDRFPIQIDLEASDIKEICYRRLLGKSPSGEGALGQLFDTYGQALRHNTKLKDAKFYRADLDRTTFINLYPFLPAHFDILLRLLGALAKSTGGVGLRSAIKVIQDILIEEHNGHLPVADRPVGWLATTVTLYDSLEKDIRRAFPSIHYAAEASCTFYSDQPLHQEVAKSIAVLQILGNLPITVENVASLMHPSVDGVSRLNPVRQAVEEMLQEPRVPLSDKEGELSFLSEKLREIDVERSQIALRSVDIRSILNGAFRNSFDPLPRATLLGSLQVVAGLKVLSGSSVQGLAGDQHPVQTLVQFVEATEYEAVRSATVEESRQRQAQTTIYALGRTDPEAQNLAEEIYRCQRIDELYRNDPDQEVRDYCKNQQDRANRLRITLQQKLQQSLYGGSFVFRGQLTGVSTLGQDLLEAARRQLSEVAEQVFDRYNEAPTRVETSQAEKFLKQTNLSAITSVLDPLDLVQVVSGQPQIQTSQKAIVSIRDYIDRNGTVEGKRLIDHFGDPPFGWSPDTLRYILAAMLVAGEITLRISGREVKAVGQQAIDALKTNKSFGKVGVGLRDYKPPMEVLGRACERLTELLGESVIPLEQEISKAALKQFPKYQRDFSPLGAKLAALGVAGAERLRSLTDELAEVLLSDASDAPERLGGEDSALYENLKWAREVAKALDNGLESTIRQLQEHQREIKQLPNTGVPATLQQELAEDLSHLEQRLNQYDFYSHGPDFNTLLTKMQSCVRDAVREMATQQQQRVKQGADDLARSLDWEQLTAEEQSNIRAELDKLLQDCPETLVGLREQLGREYSLNLTLSQQKEKIRQLAQQRSQEKVEIFNPGDDPITRNRPPVYRKSLIIPARIKTVDELQRLLQEFQNIRSSVGGYTQLDVTIKIKE
jgi:hypothetical protein